MKRPKGPQSDFQKSFEADLKAAGGQYYLIHSVAEAQAALKDARQSIGSRLIQKPVLQSA